MLRWAIAGSQGGVDRESRQREECRDEAIQGRQGLYVLLDCFAALAMAIQSGRKQR
jgi:hypothetical protein